MEQQTQIWFSGYSLPWMTPWSSVMMQATQVSHPDTHMTTDCYLDPGHLCGLRWQHGPPDRNIDIGCGRTVDPNKVLGHNQDSDVTMPTGGSTGCPVQLGPHSTVALGNQCGSRWLPRLLALAWTLMTSGATDINSDPDCCRPRTHT